MEPSSETEESDGRSDEEPPDPSADDGSTPGERMVEAGAGADVPIGGSDGAEPDDSDDSGDPGGRSEPGFAEPDGGAPASGGSETAVADEATGSDDPSAEPPDGSDGHGDGSTDEPGDGSDADGDTGDGASEAEGPEDDDADPGGDGDDSGTPDVPEELRELLEDATSEDDDADPETDDGPRAATSEDGRADDPTDLARPAPGSGEPPATSGDATGTPAAEAEPVSMRSEMSPVLAERQAFVSLLLAVGSGALVATVGNVLRLTRWETIMALVSGGIVVLLIATFVVFRAMLAAAERNDEPYSSAYTHPLFMFLFVLTTTVTALFVGYVSRLLT